MVKNRRAARNFQILLHKLKLISLNLYQTWILLRTFLQKTKIHHRISHEGPEREQRFNSNLSLTSALDGVGGPLHAAVALPTGKRHDTHCIGGWVIPRTGPKGCGKSHPPPGFDSRTVQTIAQSLYQLSYPGPKRSSKFCLIVCNSLKMCRSTPQVIDLSSQ